jgi:hypothetical protein
VEMPTTPAGAAGIASMSTDGAKRELLAIHGNVCLQLKMPEVQSGSLPVH